MKLIARIFKSAGCLTVVIVFVVAVLMAIGKFPSIWVGLLSLLPFKNVANSLIGFVWKVASTPPFGNSLPSPGEVMKSAAENVPNFSQDFVSLLTPTNLIAAGAGLLVVVVAVLAFNKSLGSTFGGLFGRFTSNVSSVQGLSSTIFLISLIIGGGVLWSWYQESGGQRIVDAFMETYAVIALVLFLLALGLIFRRALSAFVTVLAIASLGLLVLPALSGLTQAQFATTPLEIEIPVQQIRNFAASFALSWSADAKGLVFWIILVGLSLLGINSKRFSNGFSGQEE